MHKKMKEMQTKPQIILVTGIMASGKSTVAQLLAEQFHQSVHLRGDVFRKMIVNNRKEIGQALEPEAMAQLRLRYQLTANASNTYLDAGYTVIVQDVVVGSMLNDFISYIKKQPIYVVVLCPNSSVVAQREASRSKKGYGIWSVEALNEVLHNETPRIGMWLDTSTWTPEETVNEILSRYQNEAAV